ncbi:zinc-dependent alcohol dehydrogenase [Paenibacillus mendelii]|uniref:Zinc-binding dehydrogenase n=1 Tax=Paenibacillus mendelii TaxID=206163 RepID=A0ABV6J6T7_9BACL|nr:alcohol dehydrogenase catalytic domain-containing protein [Paenibacillus mendelii]MCQ6562002.1 alcohol dehydrogenase catalytic domain-containing protein [Paenibacillus mendelii]
MDILVYQGARRLELTRSERPHLLPGEAIIRVEAAGICGSELEGYLGHSSVRVPPLVMGHEFCGVIEEMAPDASGFQVGDKVIVNPLIPCGSCDRCDRGRPNICRNRQIIGIHRPGAFAQYVAVPVKNMYNVAGDMDSNLASLAEPLAVCIHAIKLGLQPFEGLMIYGAGPIGLLTLQVALNMGAPKVLVIDRQPERLAFAKRLGAEAAIPEEVHEKLASVFSGHGVDAIIDCVGVLATREQAIQLINPGGSVILVGLGQDQTALSMNHVVRQEVSLIGSYTYSNADFEQAVNLLVQGSISMSDWATTCGLAEAPSVFAALADGSAKFSKYVINPNGGNHT